MKYRIMKVGDKYAAQLLEDKKYIDKDNLLKGTDHTWADPNKAFKYCLVDTVEEAKRIGDGHVDPTNLFEGAQEVMA